MTTEPAADLRPPSALPNLGPYSDEQLREIGVATAGDLRALGSIEAWRRLRFRFGARRVNLLFLYALDGALTGHDWRRLPAGRKEELRRVVEEAAS